MLELMGIIGIGLMLGGGIVMALGKDAAQKKIGIRTIIIAAVAAVLFVILEVISPR